VVAGVKAVAPVVTYGVDPMWTMFFSFTFLAGR
jgi:hypothetical protein